MHMHGTMGGWNAPAHCTGTMRSDPVCYFRLRLHCVIACVFSVAAVRCGLKVNVKEGDSCGSIAHAHGLHVLELQQLNYNLDCTQLAPSNVTQLCVDPAGGFAITVHQVLRSVSHV